MGTLEYGLFLIRVMNNDGDEGDLNKKCYIVPANEIGSSSQLSSYIEQPVQDAQPSIYHNINHTTVADGGKSYKLIVCKSPGTNIENPGDAFMTLFASLT